MKKTLLLFITVLSANITNAQFKIKAGSNLSTFTGESILQLDSGPTAFIDFSENSKNKIGLNLAIGYNVKLNDRFSILPEVQYNQLGSQDKAFVNNRKYKTSQDYISVPVLLEYKIIDKLKIGIGPQVNYLIKSKYESKYINIPEELQNNLNYGEDDTDIHKKVNFGLAGCASYTFYKNFSIEARYILGLSNIINSDKLPKFDNSKTTIDRKVQVFQIGVAYDF